MGILPAPPLGGSRARPAFSPLFFGALTLSLTLTLTVTLTLTLTLSPKDAVAQQKQPYLFDVNLAEKPAEVQSMISEYSQGLPLLPLHRMTTVGLAGPMTLWLFHEAAQFLDRLVQTSKEDYQWPRDTVSCQGHEAFQMEPILPDGASTECVLANDHVVAAVADRQACGDAAEPELYVLGYPPGVVNNANTGNVLDLIGVMGSTFAELPPLYDGVLPEDFVPRLRDILRKLRFEELFPPLEAQIDAFQGALALLEEESACFDPDARAALVGRIEGLLDEATLQRDHLQGLKAEGEAEHQKEALRLATLSRARRELPYPSLTQADREFLAFWIGAVYWRLRGGGIILLGGTQECRRLGLRRPFNVIGELTGGADGTEAADGVYCEIFAGWGQWFDMGTTPGEEDKYYDLVKMTNRGYEQIRTANSGTSIQNTCTIPDAPFVLNISGLTGKHYDTVELFAGGLSMGPCYYFPWDQLQGWLWANTLDPPYLQVVDGPTSIGEFCTGGSIALGMARTLMRGWALSQAPHQGKDAVFFVEPAGEPQVACAAGGVYSRVTVIPLDGSGGPLPPGQEVAVVEEPPYVLGGAVEAFTDPSTGVTEYRLEVGSNRCTQGTPHEVQVRVGGVVLEAAAQVHFACPDVAEDGVAFFASPSQVPADGQSAAELRIEVLDVCGNPAFAREVTLEVLGGVPASLTTHSPITLDVPGDPLDGAAIVQATSLQTGAMGLGATIHQQVFQSDPDLVTFIPRGSGGDGGIDPDGGTSSDGGGHPDPSKSGCSCQASPGGGLGFILLPLFLVVFLLRAHPRRSAVATRSRS